MQSERSQGRRQGDRDGHQIQYLGAFLIRISWLDVLPEMVTDISHPLGPTAPRKGRLKTEGTPTQQDLR